LQHSNRWFRCSAINLLKETGHPRTVGVLIQALGDTENRYAVANALVALRETALPELQDAARSAAPSVRRNAVFALSRFGPVAEAQVLAALHDPDPGVRVEAVAAHCPLRSNAARDAVRTLLSDSDDAVRRAAEAALREAEKRDEETRLRQAEDAKRNEQRRLAAAEEQRRQSRRAAVSLAIACACGALGILWAFHF